MSCITRGLLRYGLLAGLALGGVTLLVGPERVVAGLAQVRSKAQSVVDGCVEDPAALRRQLADLADQYPERIAEVGGEIAEVDHQIESFAYDINVAKIMVRDTSSDLKNLKALVQRAEGATLVQHAEGAKSNREVFIRYQGVRFDLDEAYREGTRVNSVRNATMDRLAHDEVQLKFLQEQKGRLAEILDQLSSEYDTYRAQLWQLDRQIDSIERNDRLIELTEDQQATLDGYKRFGKVQNLKQIESKLAELRRKQEAQLKYLSKRGIARDYEKAAEYELDTTNVDFDPFDDVFDSIEFELNDDDDDNDDDNSLAWNGPIVIEN
jgi:phage shock protein A